MENKMTKPTVKIYNWYFMGGHLYGNVLDHPSFDDETLVQTSRVISEPTDKPAEEGDVLETKNSLYLLGRQGEVHDRNRG